MALPTDVWHKGQHARTRRSHHRSSRSLTFLSVDLAGSKDYCNFADAQIKRRDARVVEWAALEMRCTGNCTGGSNPSLSANTNKNKRQQLKLLSFLLSNQD